MKIVTTKKSPAAIGPYSQAMVCNGLLFTSGQIALVPESGQMVGETAVEQIKQCLANLEYILLAGGAKINTVVKVTIFLTDMNDFKSVNEVYEVWLNGHRPARSTIAVAGLPRGALVEIECVAELK